MTMNKLLLIDDETDMQYSFRRIFGDADVELETASSGEEGLERIPELQPDVVIMDVRMGGISGLETLRQLRQLDAKLPVIMMTAYGTTQTAIEAMKLGAFDYILKPFEVPKLKELIYCALKAAKEMKQVVSFQPLLESEDYDYGIVGRSEAMQRVFKWIGQVASSDATALITGESGTGKELVARAIYHHSQRHGRPFLALNCAAIPEQLLESELFGHEKGAFTGAASQRIGKFEQCHTGTVFLDEIGEMALQTQAKILRVLQSGTFERVGGTKTVQVDIRIIAATNKDLKEAVTKRLFREDLFYRLNVMPIHIPPLRERPEDIPLLINYFLRKFAQDRKTAPKSISPEAIALLERLPWEGNVRELENAVQRAVVLAKGEAILLSDLPNELVGSGATAAETESADRQDVEEESRSGASGEQKQPVSESGRPTDIASVAQLLFRWARADDRLKVLPQVERELIVQALNETNGNQVKAAKILGITRATLRKRIEKFNIRQQVVATRDKE